MTEDGKPGYVRGQSEAFPVVNLSAKKEGTDYALLKGQCPRCGHPISKRIVPVRDLELLARNVDAPPPQPDDPREYLVTCNCAFGHEDAPDAVRGCGWQTSVCVTPRAEGEPLVEKVVGDVDAWDKDEYVELATHQQLQQVRQFAGQWTAMLGVVTGFLAVGTFFDFTRADLGVHGAVWAVYVGGALVALAAAVLSVARGSQAAGLQHFHEVPAETQKRVELVDNTVKHCRRQLWDSKWLALVSVIALVVAVAARLQG
jgi:hypothetical protein